MNDGLDPRPWEKSARAWLPPDPLDVTARAIERAGQLGLDPQRAAAEVLNDLRDAGWKLKR